MRLAKVFARAAEEPGAGSETSTMSALAKPRECLARLQERGRVNPDMAKFAERTFDAAAASRTTLKC
jgi:hypothetical protein